MVDAYLNVGIFCIYIIKTDPNKVFEVHKIFFAQLICHCWLLNAWMQYCFERAGKILQDTAKIFFFLIRRITLID